MKEKFKKILKTAFAVIKTIVFMLIMFMGFLTTFCLIWTKVGLPDTDLAMWFLLGLSILSEYLFLLLL